MGAVALLADDGYRVALPEPRAEGDPVPDVGAVDALAEPAAARAVRAAGGGASAPRQPLPHPDVEVVGGARRGCGRGRLPGRRRDGDILVADTSGPPSSWIRAACMARILA